MRNMFLLNSFMVEAQEFPLIPVLLIIRKPWNIAAAGQVWFPSVWVLQKTLTKPGVRLA